jgi:hypothetical protein
MRCTLGSFCGWLTLEIEFDPVVINRNELSSWHSWRMGSLLGAMWSMKGYQFT